MDQHEDYDSVGDGKLSLALFIKLFLSGVQVVGGGVAGSLSLIADSLHNLGDACAILVAVIARRIGCKSADKRMTYGYKRADILGALINSVFLLVVGGYLIFEAAGKFFYPREVDGWIVLLVAGVALLVNITTSLLTFKAGARSDININAVFIHSASDAVASLVVIVAGVLIINYQLYIFDVIATVGISVYVIFNGAILLRRCIIILMQGVPGGIDIEQIRAALESIEGVKRVGRMHVWQLDDKKIFFEGRILLNGAEPETIKRKIRVALRHQFCINHTTLETKSSRRI
ncbi:cation diffusion facilitator family transporter [Salinisphaera sp. G21_0]|uniref:cation diffusion facilitator family transporter n=1 Tax=Salinisphaera sp. G21_0 TaxID=2821094 RepID=UPI001ADD5ECC|nr:cation diffusion facilitator family transporter [Salinisphaera sp. G21_0]MBO9481081.1 cation transporter [Salinisphaera sp. G21_0]